MRAVFFLFFFLIPAVYATGIGISPTEINITNQGTELFLINPNTGNLTFKASFPKGIMMGLTEGTIKGNDILRIPVRSDGTSTGGIITFSIKGASSLVPGVSVRAIATPKKEEIYKVRKIIDYDSLAGYTGYAFDAIRNMKTQNKGLIIMLIEIMAGVGLYRIWKG